MRTGAPSLCPRDAGADALRPHGNGNEESPDAEREQAPNKGLQLSRALGAGAYSLVGWAAWDALVKVGPSQLKPSVVRAMVVGQRALGLRVS